MASNSTEETSVPAATNSSTISYPFNVRSTNARARAMINAGGIGPPSPQSPAAPEDTSIASSLEKFEKQYLTSGPKSLSGIALRGFLLGITLCVSSVLAIYCITRGTPLWRAPFFLASLSLFHFLEFWTTAAYNTPSAAVSSYLLSSNGVAYNLAHSAAFLECVVTNSFFPERAWLPRWLGYGMLTAGLGLIAMGQVVRSVAMMQAGTNFNHIVQTSKAKSHQLVTHGVYGYLRHPSYFGFFWWGLGTQLMLGNVICFMGYAVVLWRFFSRRIEGAFPIPLMHISVLMSTQVKRRSWLTSSGWIISNTASVQLLAFLSSDSVCTQ